MSLPAGHASDRFGAVRVLAASVGAFVLSYLLFATTGPSIPILLLGFVLAGIGIGGVETAEHTSVAVTAPVDLRGSAFGLLAATQSFGNFAASAGVGLTWTLVSPSAAFAAVGLVMVIAVIALLRTRIV